MNPSTRPTLGDAIVARLADHPDGVPVVRLLDLGGGDERQLAIALWRLSVAGRAHFTYAEADTPEMAYAGPCHAVAQRFASSCPWCKERLAAGRVGGGS